MRDAEPLASSPLELVQPAPIPALAHLTPPTSKRRAYHPMRILLAELRLLLKGIRWWWYILFIGLNITGLLLPTESAHRYLLPVAWILPLALGQASARGSSVMIPPNSCSVLRIRCVVNFH